MAGTTPWDMNMVIDQASGYSETFCIECIDKNGITKNYEHTVEQKPHVDCAANGRIAKSPGVPISSQILNIAYDVSSSGVGIGDQDYYGASD